tara:strand:+ start:590 stop:1099 length:510 start_codon:yes stop_codon:yes gene_type:complete
MYQSVFSTPLWVKDINPKKINLVSKKFKKTWLSDTLSSFSQNKEDNVVDTVGGQYLKNKILECLQDFNIKDCAITQIWRNIYKNDFQERHMHANSNFSFTIYEKLKKPQTIFYHPAHDLIYATGIEKYMWPYLTPEVKQNQMILFPSYLEHLVKRSQNSMTISGNIKVR